VNLEKSRNFTEEGSPDDPMDYNGHGTHVAGIIGGSGASTGSQSYRGVAPEVQFLALKVFDHRGEGSEDDVIAAVEWALEHEADIINFSGGFAPVHSGFPLVLPPWVWPADYSEQEQAFAAAMNQGVVVVVSSGNEGALSHDRGGTIAVPATVQEILSVGAVSKEKNISSFSSAGPVYRSAQVSWLEDWPPVKTLSPGLRTQRSVGIDLMAPGGEVTPLEAQLGGCWYGQGIVSAMSSAAPANEACAREQRYTLMSGTSQAAPHISGLAALILQALREVGIDRDPNRAHLIKGILAQGASSLEVKQPVQGAGLVDWGRIGPIVDQIRTQLILAPAKKPAPRIARKGRWLRIAGIRVPVTRRPGDRSS
jgi:subtilisin family serine protease